MFTEVFLSNRQDRQEQIEGRVGQMFVLSELGLT